MKEFDAIREEIVKFEKERLQIKYYVLVILIAIAGFSSQQKSYSEIAPILYQIVLIWGLNRFILCTRYQVKLSTYIQVFFDEDFKWENRLSKFLVIDDLHSKCWDIFVKCTNLFNLLSILGLFVTYNYIKSIENLNGYNIILLLIIILLSLSSIILLIIGVFNYPKTSDFIEKWKKISNKEKTLANKKYNQ